MRLRDIGSILQSYRMLSFDVQLDDLKEDGDFYVYTHQTENATRTYVQCKYEFEYHGDCPAWGSIFFGELVTYPRYSCS